MVKITKFEDIESWKKARRLTKEIYQTTATGGFVRDFGLKDQIRRASVSVLSNIAEGFERGGDKEFLQFLAIAKGSCGEVRAQLDRGASTNKEQRRVVARMAPRIFDCEARFAHASQPMDRLTRAASQPPPQIGQCGVSTFKERAEGVVRKVNHSARCLRTTGWEP